MAKCLWYVRFFLLVTAGVVPLAEGSDPQAAKAAADDLVGKGQDTEKKRSRVRATCAPELGLVTANETAKSYAQNAHRFCNTSSPWAAQEAQLHTVLGFVAPWNDHAYRAARYFRWKLDGVVPLWYRVLPARKGSKDRFELVGNEFASEQSAWLEQVGGRGTGSNAGANSPARASTTLPGDGSGIPPHAHFSIEGFASALELRALLEEPTLLAAEVAVICKKFDFSGAIFDIRLALFPAMKPLLPSFASMLRAALRAAGRTLAFAVPPAVPPTAGAWPIFTAEDATALAGKVDSLIVGTRDFSRSAPGPSAPISWMKESMRQLLRATREDGATPAFPAEQLLMEIPTYGRVFKTGAGEGRVVLTAELSKALSRQKPRLQWDHEAQEHWANLTISDSIVYLPTLSFVAARLQLARALGVGVALRELGSGLDYLFDLLPRRPHAELRAASSSEEL